MTDSEYKNVTHCIFDMDGLLLDTEARYTEAFCRIGAPWGKTWTWEFKAKTMGFQTDEAARAAVEMLDIPLTPEQFKEQASELYKELFPQSKFMPDSERLYQLLYRNMLSKYGITYGGEVVYAVMGRPERNGAEIIIDHYKLPLSVNEFGDIYHRLQQEILAEVNLMPGAERLLRHLKENNIPIALATSSTSQSYELKTKYLKDVFELFDHRVLGGSDPDVKKGKPSPDIFLVAASRFSDSPDPSNCLVFEDAPNGVQAAVSAGMQVVMVPDPDLPKGLTGKATLVLDSLENFKPEQFGLPPFPK